MITDEWRVTFAHWLAAADTIDAVPPTPTITEAERIEVIHDASVAKHINGVAITVAKEFVLYLQHVCLVCIGKNEAQVNPTTPRS